MFCSSVPQRLVELKEEPSEDLPPPADKTNHVPGSVSD